MVLKRRELILSLIILLVSLLLPLSYSLPNDAGTSINFNYPTTTNYSQVNVNNSQYLQGYTPQQVASLVDTSSLVPYTGATSNVDLGAYALTTTGTGTFGLTNQVVLGGDDYAINATGDVHTYGTSSWQDITGNTAYSYKLRATSSNFNSVALAFEDPFEGLPLILTRPNTGTDSDYKGRILMNMNPAYDTGDALQVHQGGNDYFAINAQGNVKVDAGSNSYIIGEYSFYMIRDAALGDIFTVDLASSDGYAGWFMDSNSNLVILADNTYAINAQGESHFANANFDFDVSLNTATEAALFEEAFTMSGVSVAILGNEASYGLGVVDNNIFQSVYLADGTYAINAVGDSNISGTSFYSDGSIYPSYINTGSFSSDGSNIYSDGYGNLHTTDGSNSVNLTDGTYAINENGDIVYDGNVGIDDTFDVGTDTQITFTNGGATAISTAYDQSLMDNITYLSDTDKETNLIPVSFYWNEKGLKQFSNPSEKTTIQTGYVAQDVQRIYPECAIQTTRHELINETKLAEESYKVEELKLVNETYKVNETKSINYTITQTKIISKEEAYETIQVPIMEKVNVSGYCLNNTFVIGCILEKNVPNGSYVEITKLKRKVIFNNSDGNFYITEIVNKTKQIIVEVNKKREIEKLVNVTKYKEVEKTIAKQLDTNESLLTYNRDCIKLIEKAKEQDAYIVENESIKGKTAIFDDYLVASPKSNKTDEEKKTEIGNLKLKYDLGQLRDENGILKQIPEIAKPSEENKDKAHWSISGLVDWLYENFWNHEDRLSKLEQENIMLKTELCLADKKYSWCKQ